MTYLKDIGEHQLLDIIQKYCDRTLNGDDGAIMGITPYHSVVVTTDVLVENVHFSEVTTPPHSVGYRAVSANLSDLAAMGAKVKAITVGLSLRSDVEIAWIEKVYQGINDGLKPYGVSIIGGDITRGDTNILAITALGEVIPSKGIYRHNAKVGDVILVTGEHGLSKAGLELLLHPQQYKHLNPDARKKLIHHHQYPQPRLDVIPLLHQLNEGKNKPIGGMDSSDGLVDAIIQICQKSGVGARVDRQKIRVSEAIQTMTDSETALDWVLYGGEDFELVLSLDREIAESLQDLLGEKCHIIGEITSSQNIELYDSQNPHLKLLLNQNKTFQHF